MFPETLYAKTPDGVSIGYHVIGNGPFTIVPVAGWHGNLEVMWELPWLRTFYEKLGRLGRVIHHDRRGTGISDRSAALPDLETSVDDLCTVLDKVGARRVVPVGMGAGTATAVMFAAARPQRTAGLVLYAARVKALASEDYPWGDTNDFRDEELRIAREGWGTESYAAWFLSTDASSLEDDRDLIRWEAKVQRHWVSPGEAAVLIDQHYQTDVRHLLGTIRAPAMVVRKAGWPDADEDAYVASLIPGATLETLPGETVLMFLEDQDRFIEVVDRFLAGLPRTPGVSAFGSTDAGRILATILFTDIVGSTERAFELGDAAWTKILEQHHDRIRACLARFHGREIDTVGDGFLASFDGPARAVRCAEAIRASIRELGLEIRAGVHTGEVEMVGDDVRGITVHVGARIAALAGPGEIVVSSTVKDLVAGSGLLFEDRGEHELRGVPGKWRTYALASG